MHTKLLHWYRHHKRDLPWRHTRDPYAILISEVMLQQTQVDRVIPKYQSWLKVFPNFQSLARAPLRRALKLWLGLGYNSRAVRLRQLARIVVEQYGGKLPADQESLEALPGIGRYTAGAVMTFAHKKSVGVVDTNVRRVIGRLWYGVRGPKSEKQLHAKVESIVPARNPDQWNHALMDLGAIVCVSRRPKCEICPLQKECRAYPKILQQPTNLRMTQSAPFTSSDRYWRGRIIKTLLDHRRLSRVGLALHLKNSGTITSKRLQNILADLRKAGLVEDKNSHLTLPA